MNNENIKKMFCLIQEVIEIIRLPSTNTLFSEWNTPADAINHLNQLLEKLKNNDKQAIFELKILFGPTGSLQDLSISSGWGYKFLYLANRFDKLIDN